MSRKYFICFFIVLLNTSISAISPSCNEKKKDAINQMQENLIIFCSSMKSNIFENDVKNSQSEIFIKQLKDELKDEKARLTKELQEEKRELKGGLKEDKERFSEELKDELKKELAELIQQDKIEFVRELEKERLKLKYKFNEDEAVFAKELKESLKNELTDELKDEKAKLTKELQEEKRELKGGLKEDKERFSGELLEELKKNMEKDLQENNKKSVLESLILTIESLNSTIKSLNTIIENKENNCSKKKDEEDIDELESSALELEKKDETRFEALEIYKKLLSLYPKNCDYLFNIGRLYNRLKMYQYAEENLIRCLELCPEYYDAADILAKIYLKDKRYYSAIVLYSQFLEKKIALEELAKIAYLQRDYCLMQYYYQKLLDIDSESKEYKIGLARALYNRKKYAQSKSYFITLNKEEKDLKEYMYYVKPYTNPSIFPEYSYTNSKEDDPYLQVPVIKTLYVSSNVSLLYPISDNWQIQGKGILFHQKETDIYPPVGVNYKAYLGGAQLTSKVYLGCNWNWNINGRLFRAWGSQKTFYPFEDRISFEPGNYFIYNSDRHLFTLGGNYESFITKNLYIGTSYLQRFIYTGIGYGYKWIDLSLEPQLYGVLSRSYYRDSIRNIKNDQSFLFTSKFPIYSNVLRLNWLAEHSGFNMLTRNYFSYKRQWKNIMGIQFHYDFSPKSYIDVLYEEKWESTRDLFLPIGDTVYVAQKLFIRGYKPIVKVGYRFRDKMIMELGGYYYRDTLPYRAYNVNANINWYF